MKSMKSELSNAITLIWLNFGMRSRTGNTPGFDAGKALEYFLLRAFELEGAVVTWPYQVDLFDIQVEQIDGVIYWDSLSFIIEAKDRRENVSIESVAKLRNQLLRRPSSTIGVIFSSSGFTEPAIMLSKFLAPATILLWTGDEIQLAFASRTMCDGLIKKFRYSVERGLTDYNLCAED